MTVLPPQAGDWLTRPGLTGLWAAVRKRLESNGLRAAGSLRLSPLAQQEREALSLLLGRTLTGTAVTVRLDQLDARLRASSAGCGLVEVLNALGPTLVDRRAARSEAAARRDQVWSSCASAVESSPLASADWTPQWFEALRRAGIPKGVGPEAAVRTLHQAVHILTLLFAPGGSPRTRGRGELAAETTGTAHGLDEGAWLTRLVLRGIALAHGTELPEDAAGRRALWRLAAVTPDEVSSTVLAYGLRPQGDGWREQALRERAVHGVETHLTLRELRRTHLSMPPGTLVRICENPHVVEAAADARCTEPLVCTSGNASTAVLTVLDALASAGCAFAYHGDFDWPGITLANRVISRYGARPWRMTADDYEQLVAHTKAQDIPQLSLAGSPVAASWDPGLAPAMATLDVALHEEATLDLLVEDLA
ncbi:TIGR02679 family protein [Streptomyces iconiensis]|uniref:TIGR02679 family protein n=1 Tax=Streptomyces iconiensis TaxID=1384038 RepID=A0ABT6ZS31_9ACTN|nr:TIGR02679 family protein [Streptomyces iconiensis]MDJ1131871.1 TIGR02679 family protein [Streptomyces iconiensis]